MDVDTIATEIFESAQLAPHRRYIVAIAGIPGSGKSTLTYPLVDRINALWRQHTQTNVDVAICIGVDGWHYSRAQLRAMENSEHLFAGRGAHFTFDGPAYGSFVAALDRDEEVPFPTFSHADKDPVADGGRVASPHRIILLEGLHTLLNISPWSNAAHRYDERILVNTPIHVARERIIRRHLADGVEPTLEAARRRADESDLLNADTLLNNLITPTIVVDTGVPAAQKKRAEAPDTDIRDAACLVATS